MSAGLASAPPALWYLTRGSGAVTLVLLTLSVLFGIVEVERWSSAAVPRFMVAAAHRTVSLLVVVLLVVHVLTAVLDTFAPIALLDAVLPFAGAYRPLWLGLGAVALDLLVAVVVTSLVRRRLGLRAWRGVHWAAYACWPVAVVHGLGTGSDAPAAWMLAVTLACATAVVGATAWRLGRGWAEHRAISATGAIALVLGVLAGVVWAPQGPLARGWARRAGTPAGLLAFRPAVATIRPARRGGRPPAAAALAAGFSGPIQGSLRQGVSRGGLSVIDLVMHTGRATITVRLGGRPSPGGGLVMDRSAVALGPVQAPRRYTGRVTQLDGQQLQALVGAADGRVLRVALGLQLDGDRVTGAAAARPFTRGPG